MRISLLSAIVLLSILSVAAVTAIKKDRIKQMKSLTRESVTEYSYLPDGRVTMIKNPTGATSTFKYEDMVVCRKTDDPRSHTIAIDTFFLDSRGFARELHMGGQLSTINSTSQFAYNKDGFQIEFKTLYKGEPAFIGAYTYRDSNEVFEKATLTGIYSVSYHKYEYYPDKLNTIGNDNMGVGFQGHSSMNLLKEETLIQGKGDTTRTFYNYHFDDKGRVSIKVSYTRGKMGDSTAYSYY